MRDVQWFGAPPGDPMGQAFASMVCGFCVAGIAKFAAKHERVELVRMHPMEAAIAADTHEHQPPLLDCDGGCGRNLLTTCAQLDAARWWPNSPAGRQKVREGV